MKMPGSSKQRPPAPQNIHTLNIKWPYIALPRSAY